MPKKRQPAVIELQKLLGGYLYVQLEFAARDARRFTAPLPFLIDPASDRTLIVPMWHDEFKRCGISFEPKLHRNRTLIGEIEYYIARDFDIEFICADGITVHCEPIKRLAFVVPGQPFDGHMPAEANTGEPIAVNVLGLDVLNNFALISEPGNGSRAFLVRHDPGIVDHLMDMPALASRFGVLDLPEIIGVDFPDVSPSDQRTNPAPI